MTRAWPTVVVLLVCIFGAVLFLAALNIAQDWRCQSNPHLAYCEGDR